MLLPHPDLDHGCLAGLLRDQYEGAGDRLEFVPLGEDSWAYRCGRLWVSVRRDLRGHVPAAYETAHRLARGGLDFVLAPLAGADGRVVRVVAGLPVVVFPYLAVSQLGDTPEDRQTGPVVALLRRVHAATAASGLPIEDFRLEFDSELTAAVDAALHVSAGAGPYGARLHELVVRHRSAIDALRDEIEGLSQTCSADGGTAVLTHGEPSAANFLRHDTRLLLADWGGATWGPPERDWFHVLRVFGDAPPCRPAFLRFYEIRWILSEITEYTTRFVGPHAGDSEDAAMWQRLGRYLPA